MIEEKKYATPESFDMGMIYTKSFQESMEKLESEGEIKILYIDPALGTKFHLLHVDPGLSVKIKDDTFPVVACGDPSAFREGISILEKLLNTSLTEVKIKREKK